MYVLKSDSQSSLIDMVIYALTLRAGQIVIHEHSECLLFSPVRCFKLRRFSICCRMISSISVRDTHLGDDTGIGP
jgi:hypothetical protein